MTPAARIPAAIEVLADLFNRRRPAADALKDWGLAHRFAGSSDRAAIAGLVYDALRRKASAAFLMGEETPRALMIGTLRLQRNLNEAAIAGLFSGERFAASALSADESGRLVAYDNDENTLFESAPSWVKGDFPEWLAPALEAAFHSEVVPELQALGQRAPLDIRVNTLKTTRETASTDLSHLSPEATPLSPMGLRFKTPEDGRGPSLQAEQGFPLGGFEVQDEGSQIACLFCDPQPQETVIDLCAGGGGKTLALAALMQNQGRILATDTDGRRLAPIHARLARSGVTSAEVRAPKGKGHDPLDGCQAMADLVLVDAPCSGTGTWRRNPDAKWRIRPGGLAERVRDQAIVLDRAAALVRPGGRLVYVTCSLLPQENDEAVAGFLKRQQNGYKLVPMRDLLRSQPLLSSLAAYITPGEGLQLTPYRTGTDGFYISVMRAESL